MDFIERHELDFDAESTYHFVTVYPKWTSPRGHLHVVGMIRFFIFFKFFFLGTLRFMSVTNQPSLPTPFYSVLVSISVFVALSTVFHSINSLDNSPFSHFRSYFCSIGPLTVWLLMKVFFSSDIIPSGWLGSKHQLTNLLTNSQMNRLTSQDW